MGWVVIGLVVAGVILIIWGMAETNRTDVSRDVALGGTIPAMLGGIMLILAFLIILGWIVVAMFP